jgi:hypothetical protein
MLIRALQSLSQAIWIQSTPSHSISLRSILILSTYLGLGLPSGVFPSSFQTISYMHSSPHSCYIPCQSHPTSLDHSNYTWRRVQIIKPSLCSYRQPPVTSFLFGPNILLNSLFSNILTLYSSLNVREIKALELGCIAREQGGNLVLAFKIHNIFQSRSIRH